MLDYILGRPLLEWARSRGLQPHVLPCLLMEGAMLTYEAGGIMSAAIYGGSAIVNALLVTVMIGWMFNLRGVMHETMGRPGPVQPALTGARMIFGFLLVMNIFGTLLAFGSYPLMELWSILMAATAISAATLGAESGENKDKRGGGSRPV